MELFYSFLEWVYGIGQTLIFGNGEKQSYARIALVGFVMGMLGFVQPFGINLVWLPILIFGWAVYVWLFSLWHPSIREISGYYLGHTTILGIVLAAIWLSAK